MISGNLEDSDEEDDDEGHKKMKPKHIRWQLDDEKDETSGMAIFLISFFLNYPYSVFLFISCAFSALLFFYVFAHSFFHLLNHALLRQQIG